jgi:hypothetical protein
VPPPPAKTQQVSPSSKSSPVRPRGLIHPVLAVVLIAVLGLIFIGMFTGLLFLSGFLRVSVSTPQPTGIAQATTVRSPVPAVVIASATPTLTPRPLPTPTVTSTLSVGSLGSITFAPGVIGSRPNTKPVDAATRFPEGVVKVYAVMSYEGAIKGDQWRYEWYLDGKLQEKLGGTGWDLSGPGTTWVNVWNGDGLTPGDWELRLYIADKVVQKGTLTIEKAKSGATFIGPIRFAEGIQDGKPVKPHQPIDNFKAVTTQVYAFFDVTNLPKQTTWKSVWYRDGKQLEGVGGAKIWTGNPSEKDTWLRLFDDTGLPTGTYELKLYIEDRLVQLGTCVIEP